MWFLPFNSLVSLSARIHWRELLAVSSRMFWSEFWFVFCLQCHDCISDSCRVKVRLGERWVKARPYSKIAVFCIKFVHCQLLVSCVKVRYFQTDSRALKSHGRVVRRYLRSVTMWLWFLSAHGALTLYRMHLLRWSALEFCTLLILNDVIVEIVSDHRFACLWTEMFRRSICILCCHS